MSGQPGFFDLDERYGPPLALGGSTGEACRRFETAGTAPPAEAARITITMHPYQ